MDVQSPPAACGARARVKIIYISGGYSGILLDRPGDVLLEKSISPQPKRRSEARDNDIAACLQRHVRRVGGLARFFLPCARALAVRCLGQHGGWWRTPKHEHAEPRRSVGWAHDMENFRCDGAADRGGNGGFDLRTHKRLRSARVCNTNFKNMPASYTKPRLAIPDPICGHASTESRSTRPPRGSVPPGSVLWRVPLNSRFVTGCAGGDG